MDYPRFIAFYATFAFPNLFVKLAIQSLDFDHTTAVDAVALLQPATVQLPYTICS